VLDGLGHASCLLGDLDAAMEWWYAAYAQYREEGDGVGAARVARNVASLHGSYAGDWAVATGWLARAQRQVPADDPSSERGWVALTAGCSSRTATASTPPSCGPSTSAAPPATWT
jgi:hypothetical protein